MDICRTKMVIRYLITLLPLVKANTKGAEEYAVMKDGFYPAHYWKLCHYFRVLRFYTSSPEV